MSKDRKFKKELKKIDRLLDAGKEVYGNNGYGLSIIDEKNTGKAIDYCMKAKDVIDNSVAKETHDKPHPLLARHVGIMTRDHKDIPHDNNLDMIKNIVFDSLFNYLLVFPGNGYPEDKIDSMFKTLPPKTKGSLEDFDIDGSNLEKYVGGCMIQEMQKVVNSHDRMQELNENKAYEFGVLESFCEAMEKFKELKGKFDPEDEYYFGKKGERLSEEDMNDKVLDYALNGLDTLIKNLKKQVPNNPKSVYHALFNNPGLEHYEFLQQFIREQAENSRKHYLASNGLELPLKDKLGIDNRYIKNRKKVFTGFMEKRQDEMYKTAQELAEKGDPNYNIYLNNFMNISGIYSKILDEDAGDIVKMFNVCNPDMHVRLNAEAAKEKKPLPLYEFYKSKIPEVARAVMNVKLSYVRTKKEKDREKYRKKNE